MLPKVKNKVRFLLQRVVNWSKSTQQLVREWCSHAMCRNRRVLRMRRDTSFIFFLTRRGECNSREGQRESGSHLESSRVLVPKGSYSNGLLSVFSITSRSLFFLINDFFQSGDNAAALTVAEQYVQAFSNLAKTSNTVILPANTGDAASMVAQVWASKLKLLLYDRLQAWGKKWWSTEMNSVSSSRCDTKSLRRPFAKRICKWFVFSLPGNGCL